MTDKPEQKLSNQVPSKLSENEWNHANETIVMLNLATAQIEYSMKDGDDSIDSLTHSFTSMSNGVQVISEAIQSFAKFSDVDAGLYNEVTQQCNALSGDMHQAIIALQFYDKLVQRLSHVRNSMTHLSGLIGNKEQRQSIESWKKLQLDIRDAYTMEEDRKLFDEILAGKAIDDVIKDMREQKQDGSDDDIELF